MGQLDSALNRLGEVVGRLETAIAEAATKDGGSGEGMPDVAAIAAERDRLSEEVRDLRERAVDDARLRREAAEAVREALHDLRSAVDTPAQEAGGHA